MAEASLSPFQKQFTVPSDADPMQREIGHYDPDGIMSFYRRRPFQVLGRLLDIIIPFLWFGWRLWWDKLTGSAVRNRQRRAVHLREIITQLGPTYIKVGQALSTRPDLVPAYYMEELAKLQDQLPPFDNAIAFRFIEEELGDRPEAIYAELSANPVAAASLGQVYKGKLKTGETVAVKVQRPDLIRRITLDVYIMRSLSLWAQANIKRIRSDLIAITDEFAGRIFEEMDYSQEGRNAEEFAQLYSYLPEIYIPCIYWDYTGRRVLTMEWIEGTKLTNLPAVQAQGINATHLVEVGVACSLRQLLEHGFFHADPHPGNLLATPDGKLAYLDFGMMSRIQPYQRYGLIEAVVHLVNRDFEALAQDYIHLDFLTPDTDVTPIIPALANVFGNALGASVAELNFKSITDQMSEMMYEFPFRVPAYYALIIRSLVTLEGLAISIEPEFKVLSKAYPYIAKRLLTDPAPQLRASLKDLLFKDGSFRWNRLENLLRNARSSADYDFEKVLTQTLDFLFSERGAFIRERLAEEIIQSVDLYGRRTLFNFSALLRQQIGLEPMAMPPELNGKSTNNFDHLKNIWEILQETQGFDPMAVLPLLPDLLAKQEMQEMGYRIANGLVERVAARLIRQLLLEDLPETVQPVVKPSLPAAQV
ncbi:AarF/ABC1/UbiB kinase family protein [Spirulina sp. CCNP1310]|uniref:ABC1 kinase family protein n=1 Tax=Spirulina sp. CCNP1310 TaxID=3110249 RepID=UPI002B20D7BF|nr:AarF/ABC1/UbiB kinase family protein [Spirulina sp. CCNP1310]MEA5418010.1 AarF/ABC1/UbiB kinase family protein [Spirulina sp. CCNP1310]